MHTIPPTDVVALDALAVRASLDLVAQVTPADLARPTPCADWTLHGLLRHMIAQHHGFAAAAEGDADIARWTLRPLGPDPVADYRAAADRVLDAFAADGVADREFPLPELVAGLMFPGRQAIGFHLVDYVVHGWDVAATLDLPLSLDPVLVGVALEVARAVPGGDFRTAPGASFGPAVDWPAMSAGSDGSGEASGGGLDQIVALLGRSPGWHPGMTG
jgi:uncharacterized protein (TIGR03086 family)